MALEENKVPLSIDYYALLTDTELNIEINDIKYITTIINSIDKKYEYYKNEIRLAILKEEKYRNLDPDTGKDLYNQLIEMMTNQKETLKKEIIVSGHLSNITKKTTVRTAVIFYQNLKKTIEQQLDIAFSLIVTRLRNKSNNKVQIDFGGN